MRKYLNMIISTTLILNVVKIDIDIYVGKILHIRRDFFCIIKRKFPNVKITLIY